MCLSRVFLLLVLCSFAYGGLDANLIAFYKFDDNDTNTALINSIGLVHADFVCPNTVSVSGLLTPDLTGKYKIAGIKNNMPYYKLAYDSVEQGRRYKGFYDIYKSSYEGWILGDSAFSFRGWLSQNKNLTGNYSSHLGKGNAVVSKVSGPCANTNLYSVPGKIGSALKLNEGYTYPEGFNYINSNQTFNRVWKNDYTVCWWQYTPRNSRSGSIIGAWDDAAKTDIDIAAGFCAMGNGEQSFTIVAVGAIKNNVWQFHCVRVKKCDANDVQIDIYVDGALHKGKITLDEKAWTKGWPVTVPYNISILNNSMNCYFGAMNSDNSPSEFFNCRLDNLMIFDKALSQNEIDWLYNKGEGRENIESETTKRDELY